MKPSRKRILLAEDNPCMREYIRHSLCGRYEVRAVGDASSLEEALKNESFDLLITDLNLAGITSPTVIRRGTTLRVGRHIVPSRPLPTLVITGMDPEDEAFQEARRMVNVREVLSKPLDFAHLQRRVSEILEEQGGVDTPSESTVACTSSKMISILIVDDDPHLRILMSNILESGGYQTRTCSRVSTAMELCRTQTFDLIFLDFVLEDELGDELINQMYGLKGRIEIPPILFLTAFDDVLKLGHFRAYPEVRGILPKPFEPEFILASVREIVGQVPENSRVVAD